jgi:hypothetical protein
MARTQQTCQSLSIRGGLIRRVAKDSEMPHPPNEEPVDHGWDLVQLDWSDRQAEPRPSRFVTRLLGLLRRASGARACGPRL